MRCLAFLHSDEPEDQRLKLYLTQSYYFTQLLGFEGKHFDPLAEEAFREAVFYLDTNVVLPGVLRNDANARLFEEMVAVAKHLGISLRVTRATVNEARRVAANRRNQLNKIVPVVPKDLTDRTKDPFLTAFLDARGSNPALTPDEFMEPFDRLPAFLESIGIALDDHTEDEIIGTRDFRRAEQVLQEEAQTRAAGGKSGETLRHDLAHFVLVEDERKAHPKTWFMTRDRTMGQAAVRLAQDDHDAPFSFGLITFLHSISPFLTATNRDQSLAAVFSNFLTENIFPAETVFDIQDLSVLAETYEDAFATPPERLVPALDYVKRRFLQGRPFTNEEVPKIALELRKFLTRSADEQQRILRAEADRLKVELAGRQEEIDSERNRRFAAEKMTRASELDNAALRSEIAKIRSEAQRQADQVEGLKSDLRAANYGAVHCARRRRMLIGFAVGLGLFFGHPYIVATLVTHYPAISPFQYWLREAIRLISVLVFAAPAVVFLRHVNWSSRRRGLGTTVVLGIALAGSRLLDGPTSAAWADVLALAALGADVVLRADKQSEA